MGFNSGFKGLTDKFISQLTWKLNSSSLHRVKGITYTKGY